MPELKWDETDFLEYLEVLPQIEEYGTKIYYEVKQSDLILVISIWQYESVVAVSLLRDETATPIASFTLAVRGDVRYVKDKRGEYLEFNDCVVVSNRFYYHETKDVFDRTKFTGQLQMELSIKPHIQVKFR